MAKIDKTQYSKEQWKIVREERRRSKAKNNPPEEIKTPPLEKQNNDVAFVIGNGISREGIELEALSKIGKVYACNAVYRTFKPDYLVAVDVKMILEINKHKYQYHNEVWTNPNKAYNAMKHLNFFQPSKGWSSGPTALRMACDRKFKEIYILGFDYQGYRDKKATNRHKFNNMFKDTRNYKKSTDEATFYGNWMNQTKRCLQDFKDVKFYRIAPKDWFRPKDLEWKNNITHMTLEDLASKFNIEIQK